MYNSLDERGDSLKELEKLLSIIQKNFTQINKKYGDNYGIPLISKENKTLYIKKNSTILTYVTKGKSDFIKNGIDNVFNKKDILLAAWELNGGFSDIRQKHQYFTEILELLNESPVEIA